MVESQKPDTEVTAVNNKNALFSQEQ